MALLNNRIFHVVLVILLAACIGVLSTTNMGAALCLIMFCCIITLLVISKLKNVQKIVLAYLFITILFPKAGVKLGGLPLTVSNIFLCMSLFFCVIYVFAQRNKRISHLHTDSFVRKYLIGSLLYFLSLTVLSVMEYDVQRTLIAFIPNILPIFSLFFIYFFVPEKGNILRKIMIYASFFLVIYGTIQLIFGHYETIIPGLTVNYSDYAEGNVFESKNNVTALGLKLVSTYQNGNLYGSALIFVSIFMFGCMLNTMKKRKKLLYFIMVTLSVINLVATLSRSALIGFVVGILVMGFLVRPVRKYIFLFTGIALIYIFASGYSERIFAHDATGAGRMPQYENLMHSIANMGFGEQVRFFLIGKGFGLSSEFHNGYFLTQVESSLMNFILYSGLIGLLVYSIPLFYTFLRLVKWKKNKERKDKNFIVAASLYAALIGMLGQAAIDQLLNLPPTGQNFWIILSILLIFLRSREEELIEKKA
ncbi:O-antigen ligase family protein [Priestia megaterium]|uniref:O-antigen ligase family protein n=1 Tax=Priestia megaterium TaxID=1404 RepID=UPI003D98678F